VASPSTQAKDHKFNEAPIRPFFELVFPWPMKACEKSTLEH
jgi:hypothetical protein